MHLGTLSQYEHRIGHQELIQAWTKREHSWTAVQRNRTFRNPKPPEQREHDQFAKISALAAAISAIHGSKESESRDDSSCQKPAPGRQVLETYGYMGLEWSFRTLIDTENLRQFLALRDWTPRPGGFWDSGIH